MNKVFIGLPVDNSFEVGFVESLHVAIALDPDGSEGIASAPHIRPYRVTNQARNILVQQMLNGDWTHILMLDSDMVFPAGTLGRLLSHDVDIVGAFYLRKIRGSLPCAANFGPDGKPIAFWPMPELQEVDMLGTGAILIKRGVFEALKAPWFYYKPVDSLHDPSQLEQMSEDYVFCEDAKKAGFKVHLDGSLICGHIGPYIVWPHSLGSDGVSGVARVEPFEPRHNEDLIYGY